MLYGSATLRLFSVSLSDFTDTEPLSRGASPGCCPARAEDRNPGTRRRLPARQSVYSTSAKLLLVCERCASEWQHWDKTHRGAGGAVRFKADKIIIEFPVCVFKIIVRIRYQFRRCQIIILVYVSLFITNMQVGNDFSQLKFSTFAYIIFFMKSGTHVQYLIFCFLF